MKRPPLRRAEKKGAVLLLLLCLLPVGVGAFSERRNVLKPAPRPIRVSARTLAKYTGVTPLGGSGYVRLGAQWEEAQEQELQEGEWSIFVSGHQPCPIEAHPDTPQGWKVEFVEELPDFNTQTKTIGVRVTVPKGARQALVNDATAGLFHTRDGVQIYFSEPFQVAPKTNAKSRTTAFNSRSGRARSGPKRANSSAPSRGREDRSRQRYLARNRRGLLHRPGDR